MRTLPCRPSNSITHSETAGDVISSTNCGVGALAGAVRLLALSDCTNSFSFLYSKCNAFDVGLIPCSRATPAAAAHSRLGIGSRPRRFFLQRSSRRYTLSMPIGISGFLLTLPPNPFDRRKVSTTGRIGHAGLPKAHNTAKPDWPPGSAPVPDGSQRSSEYSKPADDGKIPDAMISQE